MACTPVAGLAAAQRADVVHGFWADEPGAVAAGCAALTGVPSVVSLAGGELADLESIRYGVQRQLLGRLLVGVALVGGLAYRLAKSPD